MKNVKKFNENWQDSLKSIFNNRRHSDGLHYWNIDEMDVIMNNSYVKVIKTPTQDTNIGNFTLEPSSYVQNISTIDINKYADISNGTEDYFFEIMIHNNHNKKDKFKSFDILDNLIQYMDNLLYKNITPHIEL